MTKLNFKHFQSLSHIQQQRQTEQKPDRAARLMTQLNQEIAETAVQAEDNNEEKPGKEADQNMTRQQRVYREMAKRAEKIRAERAQAEREQRQKRSQEARSRAFESRKKSEIAAQHREKPQEK
jgi:hypothetical protein